MIGNCKCKYRLARPVTTLFDVPSFDRSKYRAARILSHANTHMLTVTPDSSTNFNIFGRKLFVNASKPQTFRSFYSANYIIVITLKSRTLYSLYSGIRIIYTNRNL